ncbi:DinB family protein [Nocardioides donggukensis]|uniref:DinB family protein n=1 Tax=Nocardioides donggukensis TaxID=2774019 RepID=A0A927K425_9ACTN|nr:DinB family protein [Nocardioides donggukensis]MBD8869313.1 DinB family protein [Nocardioides donggukensis]
MDILLADERALLEGMVDRQRNEIVGLLEGLSEDEARARLVPSRTTPLGLVKHATFVERVWFHHRVAGVPRADLALPDDVDDSFLLGDEDTVETVRASYVDACARSRAIASGRDLNETYRWHSGDVSLRFVLTHLVQELARHAGHGDILVEQLVARRQA